MDLVVVMDTTVKSDKVRTEILQLLWYCPLHPSQRLAFALRRHSYRIEGTILLLSSSYCRRPSDQDSRKVSPFLRET